MKPGDRRLARARRESSDCYSKSIAKNVEELRAFLASTNKHQLAGVQIAEGKLQALQRLVAAGRGLSAEEREMVAKVTEDVELLKSESASASPEVRTPSNSAEFVRYCTQRNGIRAHATAGEKPGTSGNAPETAGKVLEQERSMSRTVAVAQVILLGFSYQEAETALAEVGENNVDSALEWLISMKIAPEAVVNKGGLDKECGAKMRAYAMLRKLLKDRVHADSSVRNQSLKSIARLIQMSGHALWVN